MTKAGKKTIARVLDEFLEEQRKRLRPRTLSHYEYIVELYGHYLQGRWPGHEDEEYSEEPGRTYLDRFGPEDIVDHFDEFLDYFMPRKVMAGQDTMRAAGTVTRKLAAWLADRGYVEKDPEAQKHVARKGRALAACKKAEAILEAALECSPPVDRASIIEDHFSVERMKPGRLWLGPLTWGRKTIGPVLVPEEATALLEVGADIGGRIGKRGRAWYFIEIWNVSP